jgi:hypothetical protein
VYIWRFCLRQVPEALRDTPFLLLLKVENTAPDFPAHFPRYTPPQFASIVSKIRGEMKDTSEEASYSI